MINKNKIYTKEEFKKILKEYFGSLITSYTKNNKNKYFDYYVADGFPLTEEQENSYKYGHMYLIKYNEINGIIDDSVKRIFHTYPYKDGKVPDKFIKKLKEKGIKDNPKDFYNGYIQGIKCALQYINNTIDLIGSKQIDLFNGNFLDFYE